MSSTPRRRALKNDHERLIERGIVRFEVMGLAADRDLIRSLARRLAEEGSEADRFRATVRSIARKPGRILDALRRSPLVGADLGLVRLRESSRQLQRPFGRCSE